MVRCMSSKKGGENMQEIENGTDRTGHDWTAKGAIGCA